MKSMFGSINRHATSIGKSEEDLLSLMKAKFASNQKPIEIDRNTFKIKALELISQAAEHFDKAGDDEKAAGLTELLTDIVADDGNFEDEE